MHFCYIDESGVPDIPGNTSHYVLAGLCIPVDRWKSCERDISKVKQKYNLSDAEIHTGWILWPYLEQSKIAGFEQLDYHARRYEVSKYRNTELLRLQKTNPKQYRRTKKNYRATQDYVHLTFTERQSFIQEVTRVISSWHFARLFAECLDKIHFNPAATRYSVDEQTFDQVVSRFEQYLQIYSKTRDTTMFGLLIHDNNDTVKKRHTEMMKGFHRGGTLWTSITNIIETPMFVDSQLTSMVQIADVCSYSLRRYVEKGETVLFDEIIKIADRKDNRIVGVRHFTNTNCLCKICDGRK